MNENFNEGKEKIKFQKWKIISCRIMQKKITIENENLKEKYEYLVEDNAQLNAIFKKLKAKSVV